MGLITQVLIHERQESPFNHKQSLASEFEYRPPNSVLVRARFASEDLLALPSGS